MYGCLKAALLWYELFASTLIKQGFQLNPYEPCVANKNVNGKQLTIVWYVDDLKISHVEEGVVRQTIKLLEKQFGKMTTKYGTRHEYLGMSVELKDGQVKICMKDYLKEAIQAFGEPINSCAKTPASKDLFEVNVNDAPLDIQRSKTFHTVVAKLLYISKRARVDLQVAVGFLCTRVKSPTVQDWRKLKRLLQYVNGTMDIERIISLNNLLHLDYYVDASHAVHPDMRSQTRGCITSGKGVLHCRSSKQKINTKSSTESELVGASEYLPYTIWLLYFLKEQGYTIKTKTLKQDNQSTMKILKNGINSAGKRSRHINIRFFWVADRLKKEGINIEYCPTGAMLADFFTKPLQGTIFRIMRDVVMGQSDVKDLVDYANKD